jgi:hypothetical protein
MILAWEAVGGGGGGRVERVHKLLVGRGGGGGGKPFVAHCCMIPPSVHVHSPRHLCLKRSPPVEYATHLSHLLPD